MKKILRFLSTLVIAAFLFASCQNPAAGNNGDEPQNPPESTKKEYTVSFNNNCPSDNGSVWYMCSNYAPSSIKAKEGDTVILPLYRGELTKFENNEEEGVYVFEKWNTVADGTGDSYIDGTSYQVTGNVTFYAIYSETAKDGDTKDDDANLDFSITTTYSMKVGETVGLPNNIGNYSVYYEIQSGSDVVELESGSLKAIGPGSEIVKAVDWDNPSRIWSCAITVTVDGFNGSALDYKLIGRWVDGNSYLVLNADNSGELKVYKNSSLLQESTFTWSSFENNYGKFLTLSNCSASYLEGKQYTITSISVTTLRLHGYLAFGAAEDTTWSK